MPASQSQNEALEEEKKLDVNSDVKVFLKTKNDRYSPYIMQIDKNRVIFIKLGSLNMSPSHPAN